MLSELCHAFCHRWNLERKKEIENKKFFRTWKGIMETKNEREKWIGKMSRVYVYESVKMISDMFYD